MTVQIKRYKHPYGRVIASQFGLIGSRYYVPSIAGPFEQAARTLAVVPLFLTNRLNYGWAMYFGATMMMKGNDAKCEEQARLDILEMTNPAEPLDQRIDMLKTTLKKRIVPGDRVELIEQLFDSETKLFHADLDRPACRNFIKSPEVAEALLEVASSTMFPRAYVYTMHAATFAFRSYQQNHPNPDFDFTPILDSVYKAAANSIFPESRDAAARFIFIFDRYNPDYQPTQQQQDWLKKYQSYKDYGFDGSCYNYGALDDGDALKKVFAPANRWPEGHKDRIAAQMAEILDVKFAMHDDEMLALKQVEKDLDIYFSAHPDEAMEAAEQIKMITSSNEQFGILGPIHYVMSYRPSEVFETIERIGEDTIAEANEAYRIMTKYIPDTPANKEVYEIYHRVSDGGPYGFYDVIELKDYYQSRAAAQTGQEDKEKYAPKYGRARYSPLRIDPGRV